MSVSDYLLKLSEEIRKIVVKGRGQIGSYNILTSHQQRKICDMIIYGISDLVDKLWLMRLGLWYIGNLWRRVK